MRPNGQRDVSMMPLLRLPVKGSAAYVEFELREMNDDTTTMRARLVQREVVLEVANHVLADRELVAELMMSRLDVELA